MASSIISTLSIILELTKEAAGVDDVMRSALIKRSLEVANEWIADGRARLIIQNGSVKKLKQVNAVESKQLAHSFFQKPFLQNQYEFAKRKSKTGPVWIFWLLSRMQPLLASL